MMNTERIQPESPTQAELVATSRQKQNLTLRQFAAVIGTSHQAVAQVENGTNEFGDDRVRDMLYHRNAWVRRLGRALWLSRHQATMQYVLSQQAKEATTP